ncbi:MAG: polysaccharide deacetylase family protein [Raoultibacter sp.]
MTDRPAHNNRERYSEPSQNRYGQENRAGCSQPYARNHYGSPHQSAPQQPAPTVYSHRSRNHYNAREEVARSNGSAAQNKQGATPTRRQSAGAHKPADSHPSSSRDRGGQQHFEPYATQAPSRPVRNQPGDADRYFDHDRYRSHTPQKKRGRFIAPLVVVVVLAACTFGIWGFAQAQPITVNVNGTEHQLDGKKNITTIIEKGFVTPQSGNLLAVDGSMLGEGKGNSFSATVNGEAVSDNNARLSPNDSVEITDGTDTTEDADSANVTIPFEAIERGTGAIHQVTQQGQEGVRSTMTGKISGKTVTKDTTEVQPRVYEKYAVDTQGDKVVCLTFDDGPWPGSTENILDTLKQNDAKATFFTLGERTVDSGIALLKREADEGHQVCTHSFDHARGSGQGVNMGLMSAEEQRAEVQKGQDAISAATGKEASKVFRAPGGNFPLSVWQNVESLITAEIGWNIDSGDWKKPGAETIANALTNVSPGDVILCHDGGGDRSQTVEALKIALPKLKAQGYRFITLDELLEYPPKQTA